MAKNRNGDAASLQRSNEQEETTRASTGKSIRLEPPGPAAAGPKAEDGSTGTGQQTGRQYWPTRAG